MKKELLLIILIIAVSTVVLKLTKNSAEYSGKNFSNEGRIASNSIPQEDLSKSLIDNNLLVTFDIIRISPQGDAVIAGKSQPNMKIFLFEDDKEVANFYSDSNGEWVWVSDSPLSKGSKVFYVKCLDYEGRKHTSSQEVFVLDDSNEIKRPTVLKLDSNKFDNIDIYNRDLVNNGLQLDTLSYHTDRRIILTGKALQDSKISIFESNKKIGDLTPDLYGNWKFNYEKLNEIENLEFRIETNISGNYLKIFLPLNLKNLSEKHMESKFKITKKKNYWTVSRRISDDSYVITRIFDNFTQSILNARMSIDKVAFNFFDSDI